mgnify:FL=1
MLVTVVAVSIGECACAAIVASRGTVAQCANVRVGGSIVKCAVGLLVCTTAGDAAIG